MLKIFLGIQQMFSSYINIFSYIITTIFIELKLISLYFLFLV